MRAVARNLVNTFGRKATIVRRAAGKYDSTAGKRNKAEFETTVKGVFEEFRRDEFGDQIRRGDRKFIIAAADLTYDPQPGDQVTIDGRGYRILPNEGAMSGEQAAVWTLHLRGTSG